MDRGFLIQILFINSFLDVLMVALIDEVRFRVQGSRFRVD